jgi:hypothetical protein
VGNADQGAKDAAHGDRLMRPFKVSMKDGRGQGTVQVTFHEIIPNVPLEPAELGRV